MDHYHELETTIIETGAPGEAPGISRADATVFVHALHKLADDVAPDETGQVEGEFAVPVEQVAMTLAQIVSNSMRQHGAYAYYGEMMRDVGRGELAELFDSQGKDEIKEMKYFLRRLSVLMPGGMPIPMAPMPEPSTDVTTALKYLIAGEQQAIVLFKTLHHMLGENPMLYTMEQMMTDAQEHMDKLWQYMPATTPAKPKKKATPKVAAAIGIYKNRVKTSAPQKPEPKPGDAIVPPPGSEPIADTVNREAMLAGIQAMEENKDLRARVEASEDQLVMQQQQAESMAAQNEMLQTQNAETMQQAQMAMETATQAQEQAAAQADAKMRLSMRIQQIRQMLGDIASSDPVAEEGVGFGEMAGPGTPQTATQQQQAAAEAEMMGLGPEQQAEGGTAGKSEGASKEKKPAKEKSESKSKSKDKDDKKGTTKVEVKTSGFAGRALEGAGDAIGKGVVKHMEQAGHQAVKGGLAAAKTTLKNPKVLGGAALAGGAAAGLAAHGATKQHQRDKRQSRILDAVEHMAYSRH